MSVTPTLRCAVVALSIAVLSACTTEGDGPAVADLAATNRPQRIDFSLDALSVVPPPQDIADPRITLGRELFADTRLSRDNTVACSSCHVVAAGGDDGLRTAVGIERQVGPVNTPTVLGAALNFAQFWDGRADSLEQQVAGPIHNPIEMGSDWNEVISKLNADEELVSRFEAIYADGLSEESVVDAIATYERALIAVDSPFDRYLLGDASAISPDAQQGYELFVSLGCVSCHQGPNVGGNMYQRFGVMGDYFADRGNPTEADLGRFRVTGRERDKYVFKVPSLRNAAATAPYFHDGSAATLEDAVDVMIEYQLGRRVGEQERAQLVAFLQSLQGSVGKDLL